MLRIASATLALSFALIPMAWAGTSDKSSNTLVDINNTGVINNTTAKTEVKSSKCSLQIQMQTVNLPDNAVIICLAEADLATPITAGNSIVLAGEVKSGKVQIKADVREATLAARGCGGVESITYNTGIRCFTDDPVYRADANVPGSWRARCSSAGMIPGDPSGPTKLKANPTQSVVVGLCQGFSVGLRIDPPAAPEFARTGQRTAVIP